MYAVGMARGLLCSAPKSAWRAQVVFRTRSKGWGVRTEEAIKEGVSPYFLLIEAALKERVA